MTKTILKRQTTPATSVDDSIVDPNATPVVLTIEHGCEAVCTPIQQPINACEEAIRALAHSKWQAAGCPAGDGFDFWLVAEREVKGERSESSSAQR